MSDRSLQHGCCVFALAWCWCSWGLCQAQQLPPGAGSAIALFRFSVTPPSNTVFITETTNAVSVQIEDWENVTNAFTNFLIEAWVPTNRYTTNLLTTNVVAGTNRVFRFADIGILPSNQPEDGLYVGNVITPQTLAPTNFTVHIRIRATDLNPVDPPPDGSEAFVVWTTNITYPIVPRPVNDMFTNAFKIDPRGGVGTGTNNYASLESFEKMHGGVPTVSASVWWNWSANATTNILIDSAGSAFDPILAVYTGDAISNLVLVASSTNDLINRLQANVGFRATRGVTYRIAISGANSNAVGNVRVRVAPGASPDKTSPALVITSPNRETTTANELITVVGTAREGSSLESGIARVMVQVNNLPATNAAGTTSWNAGVILPPGTNIVRAFAVDYAGNTSAADAIVVRYVSPANDMFATATRVTGVGNVFTANTRPATREASEPLHAGNEGGHSIWYSFRAATGGILLLSTEGSNFDTVLGLYTGESLAGLGEVASNDDVFSGGKFSSLQIQVLSNQLYYIAVDGYGGTHGTSVLQVAYTAPTPGQFYNVLVESLPGGLASPPGGAYPSNSRVSFTATPDPDYEFVGWEGTLVSAANPFTVTVNQNLALQARFRVGTTNYTEDFEAGRFRHANWANSASAPWVIGTNSAASGKYAVRSGTIGHGGRTSLVLATNTSAGTASFDLRTSTEAEWDYLEFYLDDVLKSRWSGDIAWTNFPFTVTAGSHRFEWRYSKDVNFSDGADEVYIDNLYIPLAPISPEAAAARLSVQMLPVTRQAQLTIVGQPSRNYIIEGSADHVIWLPLATTNSASGVIQFLDRQSANLPRRFYRTVAK